VSSYTRNAPCDFGPVQIQLTLRDGAVDRVDTWVGRLQRKTDARDLGAVSSPEAARYLLDVARTAMSKSTSSNAIMGAVLADSATVWPSLLAIARDGNGRSRASRDDAVFWLSQFAAAKLNGHPNELFLDNDKDTGEDDLKGQAVFVLSQLPNGSGNDELFNVARHNKDPRVRSKALFWLGQSRDPRALDLFEEILRG
jgi:HEAT repeat protein